MSPKHAWDRADPIAKQSVVLILSDYLNKWVPPDKREELHYALRAAIVLLSREAPRD